MRNTRAELDSLKYQLYNAEVKGIIDSLLTDFTTVCLSVETNQYVENFKAVEIFLKKFMSEISKCFTITYLNLNRSGVERDYDTDVLFSILDMCFRVFRKINKYGIEIKAVEHILGLNVGECSSFSIYLEDDVFEKYSNLCNNNTNNDPNFCVTLKRYKLLKHEIDEVNNEYKLLEKKVVEMENLYRVILPLFFKFVFCNYPSFYNGEMKCIVKFAQQQIQIINNYKERVRDLKKRKIYKPDFSVLVDM